MGRRARVREWHEEHWAWVDAVAGILGALLVSTILALVYSIVTGPLTLVWVSPG